MKAQKRLLAAGLGLALCLAGTSCTTTYDAQGRPVQTMTPEGAAVGMAAAGLIGYAIAKDNYDDRRYHHGYYRNDYRYYRRPPHGRYCR